MLQNALYKLGPRATNEELVMLVNDLVDHIYRITPIAGSEEIKIDYSPIGCVIRVIVPPAQVVRSEGEGDIRFS